MLEKIPSLVGQALSGIRPGLEKLIYNDPALAAPETVGLTSDAFDTGAPIPARFTEDGARVSPPLRFKQIPDDAKSLALVVEDADSPTPSPFCHALVWNIPPETGGLQESALDKDAMPTTRGGAIVGKNSFFALGWLPPDPPSGHGSHRYVFQLYALDNQPELEEGTGRGAVLSALKGHVLAKGLLVGTYERS